MQYQTNSSPEPCRQGVDDCMHSRLIRDARLIPEDDATKLRSRLSTGPKLLLDEQEEPLGGRAPSDVSFDPWR